MTQTTNTPLPETTTNTPSTNNTAWALVALSPEMGDLSLPLGIQTSVGRHQDNDIVLTSQQISRYHAKFNQIGSKLFVQDLGSANGTFINGERIATEAIALEIDDEVGFAGILFAVANEKNHGLIATDPANATIPTTTPTQKPSPIKSEPPTQPIIEQSQTTPVIAPASQASPTVTTPAQITHIPPKAASTQAWLVAVIMVVLIVAAIVATLFLK